MTLGREHGHCVAQYSLSGQWIEYLVHAEVISEREVLVSVPANMCDGIWSLALTEEIARRKFWWDSRRTEDWRRLKRERERQGKKEQEGAEKSVSMLALRSGKKSMLGNPSGLWGEKPVSEEGSCMHIKNRRWSIKEKLTVRALKNLKWKKVEKMSI